MSNNRWSQMWAIIDKRRIEIGLNLTALYDRTGVSQASRLGRRVGIPSHPIDGQLLSSNPVCDASLMDRRFG